MSEFRIFCIGGTILATVASLADGRIGDAAVRGSAAYTLVSIYVLLFGGVAAVAFFGKRGEQ